MKKVMILVAAVGILGTGATPATGPLDAVVIHATPMSSSGSFPGWTTQTHGSSTRFELGLGDSLASAVLEVVPRSGEDREMAVQFQIETSVTIMDEGPHLDLVDWKHSTSDWADLERIDVLKFRIPTFDYGYELVSSFPAYTAQELVDAALAAGGDRWAELARRWPDPEDGRVGVGISTVRIRIRAHDVSGWSTVFTIEIDVPMGC